MIPFLDNALKAIHRQYYDDLTDRLNYYYSTLILLFLAILVSAKQYVGDPIDCWFDAEFTESWIKYAETYCFVSNTYYLPYNKTLTRNIVDRDFRKINYYQWVPIMLAVQALLFYLPNIIWKMLNGQSGVNVKAILKMATEAEVASDEEKRKKALKFLSNYVEDSLGLQSELGSMNEFRQCFCFRCGRRANTYLTCLYLFTKFLYIANVVGQFFLLNSFFNTNYSLWGYQIFLDVMSGREWLDSGHFPRVTLCDFKVRAFGNLHPYTVQCVLSINMFNEKIFLFLWIWLCFVGICTCLNCIYWLFTLMPSYFRYRFVHKYLRIGANLGDSPSDLFIVEKFVSKCLRCDGVLLLRFISSHTGDMLVTELMFRMFHEYLAKNRYRREEDEHHKQHLHLFQSSSTTSPEVRAESVCLSSDKNGFSEVLYSRENGVHEPQRFSMSVMNGAPRSPKPSAPKDAKIQFI